MSARRLPTRRQLFVTIARLQGLAGDALAAAENDRDPNRIGTIRAAVEKAQVIALDALSHANHITARELDAPPIGPAS